MSAIEQLEEIETSLAQAATRVSKVLREVSPTGKTGPIPATHLNEVRTIGAQASHAAMLVEQILAKEGA